MRKDFHEEFLQLRKKLLAECLNALLAQTVKNLDILVIDNASTDFKLYKKSFTHPMSDTGQIAIALPMDLFSGNILYYLQDRIPTEVREEKLTDSEKLRSTIWTIIGIVAICLILFGFFA